MSVQHLGVEIARAADEVTAFVRDPANLPRWAAGLASGIAEVDRRWVCDSPLGRVEVAFCADNPWGVCDHDVTLPDGTVVTNPLRVIADGPRCQVVFTVRGSDIDEDAALVAADLQALKALLER